MNALRLELWHEGGPRDERYVLAAAVAADRADPHRAQPDPRGTYRWLVSDGGAVVASRGYSALFEEWQSTVAGQGDEVRTRMAESHTVPWIPGARLQLQRRSAGGFATVFETRLPATAQPAPPPPAREWRALHGTHGPTFLLVAEGYAAADREDFFAQADTACRLLLATEPFASRGARLQVAALFVPSRASGIPATPGSADDGTNFASAYGTLGMARYLVSHDLHALHRAVAGVRWDALVILAHAPHYGGSGIFNAYACAAAAMDPADFAYVLPHELGHSFGGLGDEYFGKEITYSVDGEDPWEAWEPNVSALDAQGRVKWSHHLAAGTPVPTPWQHAEFSRLMRELTEPAANRDAVAALLAAEPRRGQVGAFEGARYRARGMYRPETDCRMFSKTATRFCAVCQAAFEQALDQA